jgi:hypothetical protein
VILPTEAPRADGDALLAWRPGGEGKGLLWFVQRLADPLVTAELLS